MFDVLRGRRIVEGSAFVAAPLCVMTLAQLGADVIRFDPIGGGLDARRWPVTKDGKSLYWPGLNKGKRSLAVDTSRPEGREIAAPGDEADIFVTNFPAAGGWMSYDELKKRRQDLIMVNLIGNPDGTSAVDYTVNCAVGFPLVTGESRDAAATPVNHVLPAWDLSAGVSLALSVVAAERHRRLRGEGQLVTVSLADIAFATVGHLGYIQEAQLNPEERKACGNYPYGAYGCDFETRDGRRIYIVAITGRMWSELGKATRLAETFAGIETALGLDFRHEGDRFEASEAISAPLAEWCAERTLEQIELAFKGTGACWGPYRSFKQMVQEDPRCSTANPLFTGLEQPGIGRYLVPGSPLSFGASTRAPPVRAPLLGEHTNEILGRDLGMSDAEISRLRDDGIVAGPVETV